MSKGNFYFLKQNKHMHVRETLLVIDCPPSLIANAKDQKLDPSTVVPEHTANETHNGSKTERDTTVKFIVKNALYEKGMLKL